MDSNEKKDRKLILGEVAAKSTAKTGKLKVETMEKHPVYGKYLKKTRFIVFHDEKDESSLGDKVQVVETRPLSKTKRHSLVRVVSKAEAVSLGDEV